MWCALNRWNCLVFVLKASCVCVYVRVWTILRRCAFCQKAIKTPISYVKNVFNSVGCRCAAIATIQHISFNRHYRLFYRRCHRSGHVTAAKRKSFINSLLWWFVPVRQNYHINWTDRMWLCVCVCAHEFLYTSVNMELKLTPQAYY